MKRLSVIIILFITVQFVKAQTTNWQTNPQIKQLTQQAIKYEEQGDNINAIKTHLRAFGLDTTNYLAANSMAGLFGVMKDYRTEIIWARKATNLKPDFSKGYVNLGNGYAGQGNLDKAAEYYNKAAKLDPKSPYPPYELGVVEEAKGNIKQAVAYYEKSQTLDPDFEEAWYNLAAGYANLKDYDNAYRYITRFCNMHSEDKEAEQMRAHIMLDIKAQAFGYPEAPKSGKRLEDFVPQGWVIKEKALGDLNNDKITDAALVLEYHTIAAEVRNNNNTIFSRPRILLVLFKKGDHYELAAQQKTFILRDHEGTVMGDEDPYDDIEITKGILNINFQFLRAHANYKFRYQANDFYLIGATDSGVQANILYDWEFNFSTRTMVHNEGESTDETDTKAKNKTTTKKLNLPQLKKLSELKQPFAWEVAKAIFI